MLKKIIMALLLISFNIQSMQDKPVNQEITNKNLNQKYKPHFEVKKRSPKNDSDEDIEEDVAEFRKQYAKYNLPRLLFLAGCAIGAYAAVGVCYLLCS